MKGIAGVVDQLRTSEPVRTKVGSYLLAKLNDLAVRYPGSLPENVAANINKAVRRGTQPVADLKSREYAVIMALSKIDGTYDASSEGADRIEVQNGTAIVGQHRFTADLLLNHYNTLPDGSYSLAFRR